MLLLAYDVDKWQIKSQFDQIMNNIEDIALFLIPIVFACIPFDVPCIRIWKPLICSKKAKSYFILSINPSQKTIWHILSAGKSFVTWYLPESFCTFFNSLHSPSIQINNIWVIFTRLRMAILPPAYPVSYWNKFTNKCKFN